MASATMWARIIPPASSLIQLWRPGGSPQKNSGGFSFAGAALPGAALYLTAQGTGDSSLTLNTVPPKQNVPPGFFPGWPTPGGGIGDTFNPASAQGSCIGNVSATFAGFPDVPGLVQGFTGVTQGRYYFEYTINSYDIFSSGTGVGVGRAGLALASWLNDGGYSPLDSNGGGQISGGGIPDFTAVFNANETPGPTIGDVPEFTVVGVAVIVTEDYIPAIFNAQQLQPVPLVCIPCADLLIGPRGFGGFGR